jgi:hypothetical protein
MRRDIIALIGGLTLLLPTAGLPETLQQHDRNLDKRIERGDRRGSLSEKEEKAVEEKQDDIARERAEAKGDGKITQRERKSLRHDQKELSQEIYRKKHNDRRDPHPRND